MDKYARWQENLLYEGNDLPLRSVVLKADGRLGRLSGRFGKHVGQRSAYAYATRDLASGLVK